MVYVFRDFGEYQRMYWQSEPFSEEEDRNLKGMVAMATNFDQVAFVFEVSWPKSEVELMAGRKLYEMAVRRELGRLRYFLDAFSHMDADFRLMLAKLVEKWEAENRPI